MPSSLPVSAAVDTFMGSADEDALRLASGAKADTGWVANQSAGDKTVSVGDFQADLNFTGSDTTSLMAIQSFWAQFGTVVKKVQALEAALANNLRPNA